jgi:uncharacterized membrane protein
MGRKEIVMKNHTSTLLATILAMLISIMSAIAYLIDRHKLWLMVAAFFCFAIAILMFMRYRRLKGTGTSTPST